MNIFLWFLFIYLAFLLLLSVAIRLRLGPQRDRRAFFVASGSLSSWVTACSLASTSIGGSSIVVTSALIYQHGLAGLWMDLAGALGFVLLGLFLAQRVRESGVSSIAELAGLRYGAAVRRLVAAVVLVVEIGWLALQAKACATVAGPLIPALSHAQLSALVLTVVILYTLLGGQYAVSYTDVVQMGVMIIGLGLLAPAAALSQVGWSPIRTSLSTFPTSASFGWLDVLGFLILTGLPHLVGSDIYSKLLSAKDGRAAARGALFASLLKAAFAGAIALLALAGKVLVPGLSRPAGLLSVLIREILPSKVAALVLVALLATLQSTADQVLLSAVTMMGNDLWPRSGLIPLWTLGFGGLAYVLVLLVPTVIELMKVAYTVFAAGLSLAILTSVIPRLEVPYWSVVTAIIVGSSVGGGLHVARLFGFMLPGEPVIWGVAASFLGLLAGMLSRGSLPSTAHLD